MLRYSNLTIIGTSHIARQSVHEVKEELAKGPDIVAIELDKARLEGLMSRGKTRLSILDISKVGVVGFLFAVLGAWAQRKLGSFVGVAPGTEMLTAVKLAKRNNAQIALIDQNIAITLKRLSDSITWREKLRFVLEIFKAIFFSRRELKRLGIEQLDLTKVPPKELVKKLTAEMKKGYPNVYRVLVKERNDFMSARLAALIDANPDKKIVAVVGAGHEEEMLDLIKKKTGKQTVTYHFAVS